MVDSGQTEFTKDHRNSLSATNLGVITIHGTLSPTSLNEPFHHLYIVSSKEFESQKAPSILGNKAGLRISKGGSFREGCWASIQFPAFGDGARLSGSIPPGSKRPPWGVGRKPCSIPCHALHLDGGVSHVAKDTASFLLGVRPSSLPNGGPVRQAVRLRSEVGKGTEVVFGRCWMRKER